MGNCLAGVFRELDLKYQEEAAKLGQIGTILRARQQQTASLRNLKNYTERAIDGSAKELETAYTSAIPQDVRARIEASYKTVSAEQKPAEAPAPANLGQAETAIPANTSQAVVVPNQPIVGQPEPITTAIVAVPTNSHELESGINTTNLSVAGLLGLTLLGLYIKNRYVERSE